MTSEYERDTTPGKTVLRLWSEILGDDADIGLSFLENGGDSFHAVLLSTRIYETTGIELDYLEILEAEDAASLTELVTAGAAGLP